jgi:hypothetical protein
MNAQVNNFINRAARGFRLTGVAAALSLAIVSLNCAAQSMQEITVDGKDSSWQLVGTVDAMTGFQIGASGNVDFGGLGQNDNPNAGVTGNAFVSFVKKAFETIERFMGWVESAESASSGSSSGVDATGGETAESLSTGAGMHWNWIDYINRNGPTVNYDEGAFFVVMTKDSNPPTQSNAADQVAKPALFYWYKKMFDNGSNVAFDQKVWVWVKVHDGGHDPYSTSSFGDNRGAYSIWIDPDQQISDTELKVSVAPAKFANTAAAQELKAHIPVSTAGKTYHVATVLKRKTPNKKPL